MKSDFHVHTSFSKDSESPPEEMIQEGIRRGIRTICITDHQDLDYSEPGFEIEFETYFPELKMLKEKYKEQINVRIGMEFGLQPHLGDVCRKLAAEHSFDYIIGSLHLVDGQDPYYRTYFDDKTDEEGYRRTFELTLENIKSCYEFDALGHIDYIVRYGKNQAQDYSYSRYADYLDEILKFLIENGKALELNTGGWKYGLSFAHPHPDVLKRYKELGGEMVTVGSDGHKPEDLAYDYHKVNDYLKACGFKYYTEFCRRKPVFCAIP